MLRISISTLLALGLSGGAHAGDAESILPIFQENCIQCHSTKGKVKGKVNLLEISDASALTARCAEVNRRERTQADAG